MLPEILTSDVARETLSSYIDMATQATVDFIYGTAKNITKDKLSDQLISKLELDLSQAAEKQLEVFDPLSMNYILNLNQHLSDFKGVDLATLGHSVAAKGLSFTENTLEWMLSRYTASTVLAALQYAAPKALTGIVPGGVFAQALAQGGPLIVAVLIDSAKKATLGDTVTEYFRHRLFVEALDKNELDKLKKSLGESLERVTNAAQNIEALKEPMAENLLRIERCINNLDKMTNKDLQSDESTHKSNLRISKLLNKLDKLMGEYESKIEALRSGIVDLKEGLEPIEKVYNAQFRGDLGSYQTLQDRFTLSNRDLKENSENLNKYKACKMDFEAKFDSIKSQEVSDKTQSKNDKRKSILTNIERKKGAESSPTMKSDVSDDEILKFHSKIKKK